MARLMPRARTAGRAKRAPSGTAASAPTSSAGRNGQPHDVDEAAGDQAPKPARANWPSESWPV